MIALMTGLGVGVSFWLVVVPFVLLLARKGKDPSQAKLHELWEERNRLYEVQIDRLSEIRDALYHLSK